MQKLRLNISIKQQIKEKTVENNDYLEFVEETKEKYLEKIDSEEFIEEINAAGCPWWNLSCHLGNLGSYCTLSVECMPRCN